MLVAVLVLKKEELLNAVSAVLIECGLFESTVLDGEGLENVAGQASELFRELRGLFGRELVYNRTFIIHVPERSMLDDFIELCKAEGIDFTKPNMGFLMAYPCEIFIGPEDPA